MLNISVKNPGKAILLVGVILAVNIVCSAQTVVYDWSGNSKTPESYPQIRSTQLVTFKIKNVNNILFSYRLEVTQTPIAGSDFEIISKLGFSSGSKTNVNLAASPCDQAIANARQKIADAKNSIDDNPKLPAKYASSPHISIPLADTVAAWDSTENDRKAANKSVADAQNVCSLPPDLQHDYDIYTLAVNSIDTKVRGPHDFLDTHELSPGNDVSVTIYELYEDKTVSSKTFSFSGTDVLTLSAGALFSRIPDRSYEARKTPASADNVLAVEGNSRFTPGIVALLNYSLGGLSPKLDRENFGLALSAGPVVRFGTQSETSSFGFFTGVSANLYHRIYLTPGLHFGQFADFPVGFHDGSTIPANFGELNPVKRWTGRFGFAITFKTKDFNGLGSTAKVTTENGAAGAATPSPTPSSSPSSTPPPSSSPNAERNTNENSLLNTPDTNNTPRVSRNETPRASGTAAIVHVSSLNIIDTPRGDRLVLSADAGITDYSLYFADGRLYVTVQHANLDTLQSNLRGRLLRDPRVERHDNDLIVSFALPSHTTAKVAEGPFGLDVLVFNDLD
jgi:hypothetical protein